MPSYRTKNPHTSKKWHARAKRDGVEYSLGYYASIEEAYDAECRFDAEVEHKRAQVYGKHQRSVDANVS